MSLPAENQFSISELTEFLGVKTTTAMLSNNSIEAEGISRHTYKPESAHRTENIFPTELPTSDPDSFGIPSGDWFELMLMNDEDIGSHIEVALTPTPTGQRFVGEIPDLPPAEIDENNQPVFHGNLNEGKKRRRKPQPREWKRNKNKDLRLHGKAYLGFQTQVDETGEGNKSKIIQNVVKQAKQIGDRCASSYCMKRHALECSSISDASRQRIFQRFWDMGDWVQKQIYICSLINYEEAKEKKKVTDSPSRATYIYHIRDDNQKPVRVCRKMFLSTFAITEKQVKKWIANATAGIPEKPSPPVNKLPQVTGHEFLKNFFALLPKMPSHYCRKSSTKLYLEPIYNSVTHLYSVYIERCVEHSTNPVSRFKFDQVLDEQNISLFQPKKDQCDTCCSHNVGNLSDAVWNLHQTQKRDARSEKEKDKVDAVAGKCFVLTMDLESVKSSPYLKASALYYKTKLTVHNFTVYNLANNHVTCYWWDESEGELVASTFASCLVNYMKEHCLTKDVPIIVYSDGCTYQNRNAIMSNALTRLSMESNRIIIQKFLEKRHTQMECDSVHSAIESKLKNKEVHLPSYYGTLCKEARKKPEPYQVNYLAHTFFKDYSDNSSMRYPSIRPGKKVGDPVVTNLRQIKYLPEGIIHYKLRHTDEWTELPARPKIVPDGPVRTLYNARLKITERKWNDLQELKAVLPADCHYYYDQLPH